MDHNVAPPLSRSRAEPGQPPHPRRHGATSISKMYAVCLSRLPTTIANVRSKGIQPHGTQTTVRDVIVGSDRRTHADVSRVDRQSYPVCVPIDPDGVITNWCTSLLRQSVEYIDSRYRLLLARDARRSARHLYRHSFAKSANASRETSFRKRIQTSGRSGLCVADEHAAVCLAWGLVGPRLKTCHR